MVFAVAFVASIFSTTSAFASANLFKIQNAELTELSATAEGSISSFDETSIVSDVTFHQLNDFAKYTITLKNTDSEEYTIESISDDNTSPYITYEYDQHAGEQINAGENLVFVVTAKYTAAVTDTSQRIQANSVKFFIHFTDTNEEIPITPDADVNPSDGVNPKTDDSIYFSIISLIISTTGLIVISIIALKKHKKAGKFIAIGIVVTAAIATTATVKAITIETNSLTLSANIALKDRLVVTYTDASGNEHEEIVSYNEPVSIPNQTKDGYTFTGWVDKDGEPFDIATPITSDISISPKFNANHYTIAFNSNDGKGTMTELAMHYDTPIQLTKNSFTRSEYVFSHWNTSADDSGTRYDDEQEVNNLTTENNATVTLYAIWDDKVYVCREAKKLHTEPCKNTSNGGCANNNGGYEFDENIIYGTLVDSSPKGGDAYDCDINNDGIYNAETERFYYMRSTSDRYAVMFHYIGIDNATDHDYDTDLSLFPTAEKWTNPSLKKFDDNNRVARFATIADLNAGCGGIDTTVQNSLLSCIFTLENTSYGNTANNNNDARRSTYMIEPEDGTFYRVHKNSRHVHKETEDKNKISVARPVIEVPLDSVQGLDKEDEVVSFDITSSAVKNYYASVKNWITDEDSFLTNMRKNYETNNCKKTSLNPQISDDFDDKYRYTEGSAFCDQPKGYNTGTGSEIRVYLSDENTKEIGDEASYVNINNGIITNMIPGITYYWETEGRHGYIKAIGDRRLISLPSARNVRDLGGLTASNGKKIKYGRIIRGERLADADVAALQKLGITTEYDIRSEDNGSHISSDFQRHAMINYDIMTDRMNNYNGARSALTSFMNDIIAGKNIYVHCTHGSDRTGTLIYLAEALLGVSDEDRNRDFDLTAISGRPDRTRYYDHMSQTVSGYDSNRKYVYMKTKLPSEEAVREWYFHGSTDRKADEALITAFQNAVLE